MDKGQANRLAFELGKTILDSAQDFETSIADYPVDVSIRRTASKPTSRALPGFTESPNGPCGP